MKFAYFDPASGRIHQWIDTDEMSYNLPDTALLHSCTDAEWELRIQGEMMVKDGSVVPYAAPAHDIAQIKAAKWGAIKIERDRRKSGGFKVKVGSADKWFHSDPDSRIQHLGLKDKARDLIAGGGAMTDKLTILGQTVKWKTMNGSFVDVSAQVAFDIVAAAGDLDAQLFAAAETHKAAMEASADPASYDFSGGWPATFAG